MIFRQSFLSLLTLNKATADRSTSVLTSLINKVCQRRPLPTPSAIGRIYLLWGEFEFIEADRQERADSLPIVQRGLILFPVIIESCTTSSPGLPAKCAHSDADRSVAFFPARLQQKLLENWSICSEHTRRSLFFPLFFTACSVILEFHNLAEYCRFIERANSSKLMATKCSVLFWGYVVTNKKWFSIRKCVFMLELIVSFMFATMLWMVRKRSSW